MKIDENKLKTKLEVINEVVKEAKEHERNQNQ